MITGTGAVARSRRHLQAVETGQHQVEEHQVRPPGGGTAQGVGAVGCVLDGAAGPCEVAGDDFRDRRVVFDHQDMGARFGMAHGSRVASARRRRAEPEGR